MKANIVIPNRDHQGYIKNMHLVGFHDLDNHRIFQMAMHRFGDKYYIYCAGRGCQVCPILDVTDPENIKMIKTFMPVDPVENPDQSVGKIQAADGLLITALKAGNGAALARGEYIEGRTFSGKSGIAIFDIKTDPENPRFLGYWDDGVHGTNGVHRFFYNGGRYVHLSCDCLGFEGMIYRIIDIIDPENPVEVGRWWLPEQFADGYIGRKLDHNAPHSPEYMKKGWLHGPAFVRDDIAYCGYCGAGLVIVDVHDVKRPHLIGHLPLQPTFSSYYAGAKTHTALPLPGRDLLVATNEGERFTWMSNEKLAGMPQALNNIHMIDISDPGNPTLIAEFPYPEVPADFPYRNFNFMGLDSPGPFGPHNLHEPMDNKPWLEQRGDRVYCCYFHAGMRVYDVSDPYYIKEIAYYIPPKPVAERPKGMKGPVMGITEDCIVDDRGNIFMDTYLDGVYVLRCDV